jgi:hypothetical protein
MTEWVVAGVVFEYEGRNLLRQQEYKREYRQRPEVKARKRKQDLEYRNRPEVKEYQKNYDKIYKEANKEKATIWYRASHLRTEYGLTLEEYDILLKSQNNVCAICGKESKKKAMCVDHDHVTGKIRGLLCDLCNTGLGAFHDNPKLVAIAAEYLIQQGPISPA